MTSFRRWRSEKLLHNTSDMFERISNQSCFRGYIPVSYTHLDVYKRQGYHFYIRKNGDIKSTRPIERIGAHSRGFNKESIGICYEGGLDCKGQPKDTRTEWQKHSLRVLILALLKDYPNCRICGHRDLSPDLNGNGEIEPEEWILSLIHI